MAKKGSFHQTYCRKCFWHALFKKFRYWLYGLPTLSSDSLQLPNSVRNLLWLSQTEIEGSKTHKYRRLIEALSDCFICFPRTVRKLTFIKKNMILTIRKSWDVPSSWSKFFPVICLRESNLFMLVCWYNNKMAGARVQGWSVVIHWQFTTYHQAFYMPRASLLCIVVDFIVYCIVVETLDPHIWVSFIMDQSMVQSGQTSIMWLQFLSLLQSAQGPPTLYQTIDSYICPGHAISKAK